MAKLYASEMAGRVADRALQILGGRGYMIENPAARFFRELRVDRIWEGTSEIQRLIIAERALQARRGALPRLGVKEGGWARGERALGSASSNRVAAREGSSFSRRRAGSRRRSSRPARFTVVLDGSLTGRDRLEAELGGAAATTDDATLILDGYRRFGDRVSSRVSGTFALVIWDAEQDRLLCARDPIGIHPVLYARTGSTLAVASFVEPLLRHLGVHPRVDPVRTT